MGIDYAQPRPSAMPGTIAQKLGITLLCALEKALQILFKTLLLDRTASLHKD
ncbi:hypothetical protein KPG71_06900 [Roseovarius sp. PS-C2]|uniref:hypothetical protein n=1 Tax=Roseovarius sp. PS-C2 TaxID=2820814 RepID=UPI001C0B7A55|nr:hypothetical protein [Roseovarius sp. PS-C2]MBU3259733.1 hypothetical protein [Roseovarius sp. PS-C2]